MNADISAVAFGVLSATDVNSDALTYSIVTGVAQGVAEITNAATGEFTYTPKIGAAGTDSFTFTVNDGQFDSGIATVTIQLVEAGVVNAVPAEVGGNGGSLNFLFIMLISLLPWLRSKVTTSASW